MFPNAQFICGEEGGRRIGKVPPLPPGCVELDFFLAMEMAAMGQPKPKRGARK